jgi:transposase
MKTARRWRITVCGTNPPQRRAKTMTYIGVDVHKRTSTLAYLIPATGEVGTRRIHTTPEEFEAYLGDLPEPWIMAMEATREAPAVSRWLQGMGVDVRLVDPQSLSALAKLRVSKTDAKDAELIRDALHHDYLPECYNAPDHVVERRALTRGHKSLREIATKLRNHIRVIFCQWSFECNVSDLQGKAACERMPTWLEQLPESVRLVAQSYWSLLCEIENSIKAVDHKLAEEAKADSVATELTDHPGVGNVIAMGLMAEMGEATRFPEPKRLHSYSGVVPVVTRSGDFSATGQLPRRCNQRLRYWAVQGAQCAARASADSKAKRTYQRVSARHGPNTAKIAAARDILTHVLYVWTKAQPRAHQDC